MTTTKGITHAEGVGLCERYLRDERQCFPVLCEPKARSVAESPDALGWVNPFISIVVDWKCSLEDARSHLQADNKPWTVRHPEKGMGMYRYLACEPHVVEEPEVADWPGGILWWMADTGQWWEHKVSPEFRYRNVGAETAMLIATVANLTRAAGKSANDARPSARNQLTPGHIEAIKRALIDGGPSQAKHLLSLTPDLRKRFKSAAKLADALSAVAGEHDIEVLTHGGPVTFRHRAIGND